MDFRPPPVSSTPIPGASAWNPLHHLSLKSEKRWAESSRPEFPDYTFPEDDERTKFDAKNDNRKDDPTNRMYSAPVAFSAPSAPFKRTVTFKSSEEIDNDLAMMEASKLMSKLPALTKHLTSICPLEEILGTDNDGYKVGLVNALTPKTETDASAVDETVCAASENLLSLTCVDVAHAIVAIAPIFNDYFHILVQNQCDGKLIAYLTEGSIDSIAVTLSLWEIANRIHRTRIAQVFTEWRTNPPKPATTRKPHQVRIFDATETYEVTSTKAGTLASEIPDAVKATSLKIDQHYSQFKKLNLMPLKVASSKAGISSTMMMTEAAQVLRNGSENRALAPMHSKDSDLSVKYPIPRDKLSIKNCVVEEKHMSESEMIANRLTSSQSSSDFQTTAATILHYIDSPLVSDVSDECVLQHDTVHQRNSDSTAGLQTTSKLKKSQTPSHDASPNVYSRPTLPASRYTNRSDQNVTLPKYGIGEETAEPAQTLASAVENTTESEFLESIIGTLTTKPKHVTHALDSQLTDDRGTNIDLSPKKARQNSPMTGEAVTRVLTPKSKTDGRIFLDRPSSAVHRVVWVDDAEKEERQVQTLPENAITPDAGKNESDKVMEAMRCKTPLTIYLNAADKNFRPTKSKYNAGLQLLPLRQATDSLDGKFDSKQRSVGLRFGERAANVTAVGVSASGVQFNPVSALFRSKRWKTCSNYPLFTSKLKSSKDLQRFARLATTPRFRIDFGDECSMMACIESSKLFALHFAFAQKYDDLGQLQFEPLAEDKDSTKGFFWTGQSD
jgi:hypothetical protein